MKLGIGIISAGKVGSVLGGALVRAGHTVVAVHAPSEEAADRAEALLPGVPHASVEEIVRTCELVLLALPGDQIKPLVDGLGAMSAWQQGQLVVHTCGYLGTEVLEGASQAGSLTLAIHPAMTFTGTSLDLERLSGATFAVSGPAMILPIAHALVTDMGGEPVEVPNESRAAYHAGLTMAGEHLATLVTRAMTTLERAGIDDPSIIASVASSALDSALRGVGPAPSDVSLDRERASAEAAILPEKDAAVYDLLARLRREARDARIVPET